MREMKFRAWDKNLNVFLRYEFPPVRINSDGTIEFPTTGDIALQQYTGLKDKNGKEIYEGDIITADFLGEINYSVIRWDDGGFWCKYKNGSNHLPGEKNREVIGNIYENPDLLKETL